VQQKRILEAQFFSNGIIDMSHTLGDLTYAVRLLARERYRTDEEYRTMRSLIMARYYVKSRILAGKKVKPGKHETIIHGKDSTPTCPESEST